MSTLNNARMDSLGDKLDAQEEARLKAEELEKAEKDKKTKKPKKDE